MTAAAGSAVMADPPGNSVWANGMEQAPIGRQMAGSRTGLICIWAIYASMLETGRRCGITRNAPFEAELECSVSRLEDYARQESPNGAAFMASYRPRLAEPGAGVCSAGAVGMYADMSRVAPETVRTETDRFLASSPPVQWGTCL